MRFPFQGGVLTHHIQNSVTRFVKVSRTHSKILIMLYVCFGLHPEDPGKKIRRKLFVCQSVLISAMDVHTSLSYQNDDGEEEMEKEKKLMQVNIAAFLLPYIAC